MRVCGKEEGVHPGVLLSKKNSALWSTLLGVEVEENKVGGERAQFIGIVGGLESVKVRVIT